MARSKKATKRKAKARKRKASKPVVKLGPRAATMTLVAKAVKAAGKKGKGLVAIAKAIRVSPTVGRRVVQCGRDLGALAKKGESKRSSFYVATGKKLGAPVRKSAKR